MKELFIQIPLHHPPLHTPLLPLAIKFIMLHKFCYQIAVESPLIFPSDVFFCTKIIFTPVIWDLNQR